MTGKGRTEMNKDHCALCGRKRTPLEPQRKSININPYSETIWPVPGGKPAECWGTSTMTHATISIRRNGGENDDTHICLQCTQESLILLRNEIDRLLGENEKEIPKPVYGEDTRFALHVIKEGARIMRILAGIDDKDLIKSDPAKWSNRLWYRTKEFQRFYERLGEYFPGLDMNGIREDPLKVDPGDYVEGVKESIRRMDEKFEKSRTE